LVLAPTLAGNINYTGGTTVNNGGTLQTNLANAMPATGNVSLQAGGTFNLNGFNQTIGDLKDTTINPGGAITLGSATLVTGTGSGNTTFSGTINGTGGLTKQGVGTLTLAPTALNAIHHSGGVLVSNGTLILAPTLAGNINYTGGTVINGGILQINTVNALPLTGDINVQAGTFNLTASQTIGNLSGVGGVTLGNATLTVGTATPSTTFSGNIVGVGNVMKQGNGTWIITGNNNYLGTTTVNAGILQGNVNSLPGNIINNSSLVFDQAIAGIYTNIISGNGNVIKQNIGTVTFTGNHTYSGGTTINGGQLSVNGSIGGPVTVNTGATLAGSGTINGTVINHGIVAPGNSMGTLTLNGDYHAGPDSVTSIEITADGTSVLSIDGTAYLNGTLNIIADPGTYIPYKRYLCLTANDITGNFSAFTPLVGFYRVGLLYNQDDAIIEITFSIGKVEPQLKIANANQLSIARYIDSLPIPTVGSDLGDNVLGPLLHFLQGPDLANALENISPGKFAANTVVLHDHNALVNSINTTRLAALREGRDTPDAGTIFLNPASRHNTPNPLSAINRVKGKASGRPKAFNTTRHGLNMDAADQILSLLQLAGGQGGVWTYGFGQFVDQRAHLSDPGFDVKTGGMVVGIDRSPYHDVVMGIGAGHAASYVESKKRDGQTRIANDFLTFYGSWSPKNWYLNASALTGFMRFRSKQHINFLSLDNPYAVNRLAFSEHNGFELAPHVGVGYEIEYKEARVMPFANLDYSYLHEGGYITHGADGINQKVRNRVSTLLRSEAGVKVSEKYHFMTKFANGHLIPNITVSVVNKRLLKKAPVRASFIEQGSYSGYYNVNYFTSNRNELTSGLGLIYKLNNGAYLSARFDSEFGVKYQSYEVNVKAGISF